MDLPISKIVAISGRSSASWVVRSEGPQRDEEKVIRKFEVLIPSSVMEKDKREQLIETINNLEDVRNISSFTQLLRSIAFGDIMKSNQ